MNRLDDILIAGNNVNASDVLLVTGSAPIFRINGKLTPQEGEVLMPTDTSDFAESILTGDMWDVFNERREIDLSYGIDKVSRYRVNVFFQRSSISLAFRIIPRAIPSMEILGLPSTLKDIVPNPHGLFLVTGPTGSGKSTSLASMIDYMNQTLSRHVITLEDPIEYLHSHNKSIIEQREIGFDTISFQNGLRASLRQDPDVILVGEMRDVETIKTALTAAETGHLVLATLHTQDAAGTIDRIIDVFPGEERDQTRTVLASVLLGVMSQRLLKRIDKGGRVVATEMLVNNSAVRNLIREGKINQIPNVMQSAKDQGMHIMKSSIEQLVMKKQVSRSELIPYTTNT